ncbi:MAG: hypothetical protein GY895_15790 [Phycisphaera sp.]|nr:hypothetical protein [Phycisphaera sp.]
MPGPHRSIPTIRATAGILPLIGLGRLAFLALAFLAFVTSVEAQTTIQIDRFGAGNAYRPGGPAAIRVIVTSDLDEAVPGILQWEVRNRDGDVAANLRRIAVPARGGTNTTWLLGDLPSSANPSSLGQEPWFIRLFEYRDGDRVRELASTRIDPNLTQARAVLQQNAMSLTIGPNPAGLGGYAPLPPKGNRPGLNEEMVSISGVEPGDLPDSWVGLDSYDLIVWAANEPRFSPSIIGNKPSTEKALREWMERGGHLVILLPSSGDPWRIGRDETVFGDLLLGLEPTREADYPLFQALPALSDREGLQNPDATITLHHFDPGTLKEPWRPLAGFRPYAPAFDESSVVIPERTPLAGRRLLIDKAKSEWPPAPAPLIHAVRRDVGHGTLDVVGIDASDPDLRIQQSQLLPKAWVFWNPILGRSSFTGSGELFRALEEDNKLARSNADFLGRGLVPPVIAISAAAASGVLVALVLFAIYWLLAGPLGFSILTRLGWKRHAWLVFTGIGGVFAVIAWSLGLLSVGGGRDLKHLTVLSDVYITSDDASVTAFDHATCWFSTRLPGYGSVEIAIGDGEQSDALAFFSPPPPASSSPFPNASRYEVPFDSLGRYEVPARATSAEFVADWTGQPLETDGIWKSSIKVDIDRPIAVSYDPSAGLQVDGVLLNATGTDLKEVTFLLTLSRRLGLLPLNALGLPALANTPLTGVPPNLGVAVSLPNWPADKELDLKQVFSTPRALPSYGRNSFRSELASMFPPPQSAIGNLIDSPLSTSDRQRNLRGLSIHGILPSPPIVTASGSNATAWQFIRQMGRSIDVSTRTTESTLLVLGFAENVPCPVPITVDGERRTGNGDVMLQWIHPLPIDVEAMVPPRDQRFDPREETDGDPD